MRKKNRPTLESDEKVRVTNNKICFCSYYWVAGLKNSGINIDCSN